MNNNSNFLNSNFLNGLFNNEPESFSESESGTSNSFTFRKLTDTWEYLTSYNIPYSHLIQYLREILHRPMPVYSYERIDCLFLSMLICYGPKFFIEVFVPKIRARYVPIEKMYTARVEHFLGFTNHNIRIVEVPPITITNLNGNKNQNHTYDSLYNFIDSILKGTEVEANFSVVMNVEWKSYGAHSVILLIKKTATLSLCVLDLQRYVLPLGIGVERSHPIREYEGTRFLGRAIEKNILVHAKKVELVAIDKKFYPEFDQTYFQYPFFYPFNSNQFTQRSMNTANVFHKTFHKIKRSYSNPNLHVNRTNNAKKLSPVKRKRNDPNLSNSKRQKGGKRKKTKKIKI